ncbi:hypothetical protein G836_02801 [Escherichia coli HVH 184 (4-3343286)]|nr:hypothetical protein G829_02735 [Escherichia coli HVH 175 (4-3405184)]EQT44639.1 hypothetical protein G836_02801 [Escherichia coli HVH 184 (4-3343286)]
MKPSYEELEEQLNRSRRLCDAALANERAWETAMMQACGEDGPKSVADKFAELEARCAALAAESAVMLETIEAVRSVADNSSGISGWHLNGDIATWEEILPEINDIEPPATDAFLAEVRAQGVEMYADNLDNGADDAERGGFDDAVKFLRSEASGVRLFADQLRKGGNQ